MLVSKTYLFFCGRADGFCSCFFYLSLEYRAVDIIMFRFYLNVSVSELKVKLQESG